jgi:sugar/nucleoside kinase (ribokinase family)
MPRREEVALQDTPAPGRTPPAGPVLVVGAASRDLDPKDPRGWRLGGAVLYGALTLARLGLPVRALAGVDRVARTATELDLLRASGVILELVALEAGPVFENLEPLPASAASRRQRLLSASAPLDRRSLPLAWRAAAAGLLLAPVAGELGPEWADVVGEGLGATARPPVALGWQGLLRELRVGRFVHRRRPAPHALVAASDLVGVSRADLPARTQLPELSALLRPGAWLAVTDAARGGTVARVSGARPASGSTAGAGAGSVDAILRYEAIPSAGTVDPTGAGDVFLATLLAARIDVTLAAPLGGPASLAVAAVRDPWVGGAIGLAAAMASLVVEAPGLAGVADRAAALARASASRDSLVRSLPTRLARPRSSRG